MTQTETFTETANRRWWELRKIQIDNGRTYVTLVILALLAGFAWGSLSQSAFDNGGITDANWYSGFWQNFSTEMIGAVITFLLFELVLGSRQREDDRKETERRDEQLRNFIDELNKAADERTTSELKKSLLARLGSRNETVAFAALDEIRGRGWLQGEESILQKASLLSANLSYADLKGANLSFANMWNANLISSDLTEAKIFRGNLNKADLRGANLFNANLMRCKLNEANVSHANLSYCNLSGALGYANFTGSDLSAAKLKKVRMRQVKFFCADLDLADLSNARFLEGDFTGADLKHTNLANVTWHKDGFERTLLPDGTEWTQESDVKRFTDVHHPLYEATRENINVIRLENGYKLVSLSHFGGFDGSYPLPGERLTHRTMLERVNARRAELGLEPLK